MAGSLGRADFLKTTREIIAKRAGYTCSFPNCGRRTVGPADDQKKFSNVGVAAHIYGAARSGRGPRGTGQLTDEERRSPTNGIWLCAHHAALIDKHEGADYPASVLHAYKALHETRMAHEVAGVSTPVCWVNGVTVESSPVFRAPVNIPLAKLTLLVGNNGVGKTGLCEWIAGTSDPKYFTRWWNVHPGCDSVAITVCYASPDPHVVQVQIRSEDSATYRIDNKATVASAGQIKVVFPMRKRQPPAEGIDDLRKLAQDLDLHRHEVRALCESLESTKHGFFFGGKFQASEESRQLFVRTVGVPKVGELPYGGLSGSEQQRLKNAARRGSGQPTVNRCAHAPRAGRWSVAAGYRLVEDAR